MGMMASDGERGTTPKCPSMSACRMTLVEVEYMGVPENRGITPALCASFSVLYLYRYTYPHYPPWTKNWNKGWKKDSEPNSCIFLQGWRRIQIVHASWKGPEKLFSRRWCFCMPTNSLLSFPPFHHSMIFRISSIFANRHSLNLTKNMSTLSCSIATWLWVNIINPEDPYPDI